MYVIFLLITFCDTNTKNNKNTIFFDMFNSEKIKR